MTTEVKNYSNLKLSELKLLIEERDIPYKPNKDDIIKLLMLDDSGKYIPETTYEKTDNGFIVGISINNRIHLLEMSKLIEKKEARNYNLYANNRIHFFSSKKLI